MLSMCSLVCRLVRGWKQSEATTLISQAATTPGSSLLLHDLNEPDLNVEIGSYVATPYTPIDVLLNPYGRKAQGSVGGSQSGSQYQSAFCQAFTWPEGGGAAGGDVVPPRYVASLFCRRGCGGEDGKGECELLHPPARSQVIWCDNNRQASLITPRQTVDLSRWTLFLACEDKLIEHTIQVPAITVASATTTYDATAADVDTYPNTASAAHALSAAITRPDKMHTGAIVELSSSVAEVDKGPPNRVPSENTGNVASGECDAEAVAVVAGGNKTKPVLDLGDALKTPSVNHGFGIRGRSGSTSSSGSGKTCSVDSSSSCSKTTPIGGYDGIGDGGEKITILLEARYNVCGGRGREDDWRTPVMADQVSEAYAWKCRGVFGVIAHTTPQRLLLMVDAFFANNLMLDSDLHVTKILTVDCVGVAGRMMEPSTIAESVTPGGYYHTARQHQHSTLIDAARCLSATTADITPERSTRDDSGGSNPNLQNRSSSPFTHGNMSHSSSFTSSPYRRPHSASGLAVGGAAASNLSPLNKSLYTSATAAGTRPASGEPTSPVPLEEVQEELESNRSSLSPEPESFTSEQGPDCHLSTSRGDIEPEHKLHARQAESASDTKASAKERASDKECSSTAASDDGFNVDRTPPNILVYAANNNEYYESIKLTLLGCLKKDRYAVYHLNSETAFRSPWVSSTTLLVICGDVHAHISTVFIRYLLNGGRVLSICSDFLNVAVPLFGTVEVADSDVVSVRYGRWGSVQFLHHQHCSHSSPQHNRFSTHLDADDKPGTPAKSSRKGGTVSVEPTHVEIRDTDGVSHCLELRVLAKDETWGAPSLIAANIKGGRGRAVFSQVHLERHPTTPPASAVSLATLQRSATARREILRDLLSTELLLDTEAEEAEEDVVVYTPALLLGDKKLKDELLKKLRPKLLGGQELHRPQLRLVFVKDGCPAPEPSEEILPVIVDATAADAGFDQDTYFKHLHTKALGRLLLYCDVVSSSTRVLEGATPLLHGMLVVPRTQTQGMGRGGNVWLSPSGCLMFSLQLHLPLSSFLGSHLPLLQHIVSLAVVRAMARHDAVKLQLKWPNDIYVADDKIGGVLVTAAHTGSMACVNVGVGINLTNAAPTVSFQQLLHHNSGTAAPPRLCHEAELAGILNTLEQLMDLAERQGPEPLLQQYYSCWKHGGAEVTVLQPEGFSQRTTTRGSRRVTITGIDYYGFLKGVDCATGEAVSIHPDGNSFNMMEGLVYTKVS